MSAFLLLLGLFELLLRASALRLRAASFSSLSLALSSSPSAALIARLAASICLLDRVPGLVQLDHLAGDRVGARYFGASSWAAPLMISGVRASSIRMRVHLVDDREIQRPLHLQVDALLHVVAQVVEAELAVRAVGDVALRTCLRRVVAARLHVGLDVADADARGSRTPGGPTSRRGGPGSR